MNVDASIFREYDIRGVAGEKFTKKALLEYEKWYGKFPGVNITPEVATAIGRGYGTMIRKKGGRRVIVGHELRPYGEELKRHFIRGVLDTGCDVEDAGVALTPIVYFATEYYGFDGGVNVTGSHNVYFFNGFKLMGRHVDPIFGEELQDMRRLIEKEEWVKNTEGKLTKKEVFTDYRKYLLEHNRFERKFKVVIDSGNGSAGKFAPQIFRELGCEVTELFSRADARFPNHVPDPEDPYAMRFLIDKTTEEKADMGIGFDADGDRFGAVDEKGKFINADHMILVISRDILTRKPGKKILYDIKCSRLLDYLLPGFGGIPLMHKTGHAPIKRSMREDKEIIFGGEISGHFYFAEDYFRIDDGLYAAAKFLQLMSKTNLTVSQFMEQVPETISTPELKLPCEDRIKHEIVDKIKNYFVQLFKVIDIDGARIEFSDTSWGLVRASNTSPYLTIRFEADTAEELIKCKNRLADELEKYPEIGDRLDRKNVTSHTGRLGWI